MKDADMQARLKELYLPPAEEFVLVDVPDMRFVMLDGRGFAAGAAPADAAKWLFAALYPIKRLARQRMGKRFVEPPLEGLWWADDPQDFVCGKREKLNWRMMVVYEPDWLTTRMFEDGVAQARVRLGEPPASLRLECYHEGLSAQIMYVGPGEAEAPTIKRMHEEFLPAQGLVASGYHHEIYLTDPNRVAPEKRKTVLRQPARRAGASIR